MSKSTNAQIILKNDNTFEIIPETYGTALDTEGLIKLANKAVKSSTEEVNVAKEEELYEQPVVMATDENLVNQEEALNTFLNTEITYQLPNDETRVLGRDTTSQWVSLQAQLYERDEGADLLHEQPGKGSETRRNICRSRQMRSDRLLL